MMNVAIQEQDERMKLERLADAQLRFLKRWRPEDYHDQYEFERELLYLVHLIYAGAQAPVLKQLTDTLRLMPFPMVLPD